MVTPAYQPGCTLEPLLERVELRETAGTMTCVYSHYVLGVKQLTAITLPFSHWRLMDHAKVRNVGAVIVDMEATPVHDAEPDIYSASEPAFELGSF